MLSCSVILIALFVAVSADIHYVRMTDSPPSSCPGQPCLTLHQYAQSSNFTTGTTFLFLPGNHSLQHLALNLTDVSNITFSELDSDSAVSIISTNMTIVQCNNVTGLRFEGLLFIPNGTGDGSALKLINCDDVIISNTVFQGGGRSSGRPVYLQKTKATILNCEFEGNNDNGAILLRMSHFPLYGNIYLKLQMLVVVP